MTCISLHGISQELSLSNNFYQLNQTITYSNATSTVNETMSRFTSWKNKIDTVKTIAQNSNNYSGYCNVLYNEEIIKYDFNFQANSNGYEYTIINIKYLLSNAESAIESISDNTLKNNIIILLNEHLVEITKTLNTELQDF